MILPDVLEKKLEIVFCGTAAGDKSAALIQYYAGLGNQFYSILAKTGLTPYQLSPTQFLELPKYGIGLTDLVKKNKGNDHVLSKHDFDVREFTNKIFTYQPKIVCFNGKKAAAEFYGHEHTRKVHYGLQGGTIGLSQLFVAPSTSGSARAYWDEGIWNELSEIVKKLKQRD